jgi:hypothetical protein
VTASPFDPVMLVRFAFPELPTAEELDALTRPMLDAAEACADSLPTAEELDALTAPMLDAAHDTLDTLNPETPDP